MDASGCPFPTDIVNSRLHLSDVDADVKLVNEKGTGYTV